MELWISFVTVLGVGVIELWLAIPTGVALQLHPVLNGLASALGAIIGALLVIFLGDRLRNWILKKRGKAKGQEKRGWIYTVWDKYGVIGLGLLSPLITGAPLGAAIGISLGASPGRLLFWMALGIVVWSLILTTITTLGLTQLQVFQ